MDVMSNHNTYFQWKRKWPRRSRAQINAVRRRADVGNNGYDGG